jgi:PTS hybrid protein
LPNDVQHYRLRDDAMVGIVLVSHSRILVQGLQEMLAQIGSEEVPVALAGGTADGGLGTSVDIAEAAIEAAEQGDGVVVIPDLGSAVLTVKSVLEGTYHGNVVLVDAPFVEGAVAAAVTAASGATLDEVADAARQARDVPKL